MSITILIIIVTVLVSYLAFSNPKTFEQLKHYPYQIQRDGSYYRILTGGLLHGDWMHLGINMYVFYLFGSYVEQVYTAEFGTGKGRLLYFLLYFVSLIVANFVTFLRHRQNPTFASVGASGAVSGVVFSFIVFNPWSMRGPSGGTGSGCILPGKRILSNAHVVGYETFIQVRKHGDAKRYQARVVSVSHAVDLALSTVDDPDIFEGVTPLELGDLPEA